MSTSKIDVKTSKSSYWRDTRESSYTPHVRHFLAPAWFTEIPVRYARNNILHSMYNICILNIYLLPFSQSNLNKQKLMIIYVVYLNTVAGMLRVCCFQPTSIVYCVCLFSNIMASWTSWNKMENVYYSCMGQKKEDTCITSKFSEFSSPAFEICFEGYYL